MTTPPQLNLHFSNVSEAQQELLVAIYVGAFNRAPEYEGLVYWAGQLSTRLNNEAPYQALEAIGRAMYAAGAENGEGGTQVTTHEFVKLAYENSLGRSAAQNEIDYWANEIDQNGLERGLFMTHFLDEAFKNAGDGEFLQARVSVAQFMAQEHVSGPGAPGNDLEALKSGIAAVKDQASALSVLNQLEAQYGTAPIVDNNDSAYLSRPSLVDIHLLKPDAKNISISGFENNLDQFGMSEELKALIGSIEYTGEPDDLAELQSPEYFTGVAGQAALLRDTQRLIIDVDGDGLFDANIDISINLPGVFQLEEWNFLGSDNPGQGQQPARTLTSTPDVADVHTLQLSDGNLLVQDFDVELDRFSMSAELKAVIGRFDYVGEPDNLEELHTPEYFTGVAGQAALVRDSNMLVIDVNGDGVHDTHTDITISMPGVHQLEDYNFLF